MFFVLSKALVWLLKPIIWIAFLLILGVLSRKRGPLYLALLLLALFSNPGLYQRCMRAWELPYQQLPDQATYTYGVLLGGYLDQGRSGPQDGLSVGSSGNRLIHTLPLLHKQRLDTLILSGGSGAVFGPQPREAVLASDFLRQQNIHTPIILERKSRNTAENAAYTARLLPSDPDTLLLITSAFHMRRAAACFRKQGLSIRQYPVDSFSTTTTNDLWQWYLPAAQIISDWEKLIKEWVGYVVYKINGYA